MPTAASTAMPTATVSTMQAAWTESDPLKKDTDGDGLRTAGRCWNNLDPLDSGTQQLIAATGTASWTTARPETRMATASTT